MITRPMLAGKCPEDLRQLRYPVLVTPKIDGIRCLKVGGKALSRTFKPIRNTFIRKYIETNLPDGVDGELVVKEGSFQDTSSAVMSEYGEPDFRYQVFDYIDNVATPYEERMRDLDLLLPVERVEKILPSLICIPEALMDLEKDILKRGYEGLMIRDPKGPYKCGRSTTKEGWLLKLKRFQDSDAIIVGFQELYHNENSAYEDKLGLTKRSSHQENLQPGNTLGALVVTDIKTGKTFDMGTGFDAALRKKIWENRLKYINTVVKYKYQAIGTLNLPRTPVFLGFRDLDDL